MKYSNIGIKGIGSYLPPTIRSSKEIETKANTTEEWMDSKLGIKERRNALNSTPSDLGVEAALRALKDANLSKDQINQVVLVGGSTRIPAVQDLLE